MPYSSSVLCCLNPGHVKYITVSKICHTCHVKECVESFYQLNWKSKIFFITAVRWKLKETKRTDGNVYLQ